MYYMQFIYEREEIEREGASQPLSSIYMHDIYACMYVCVYVYIYIRKLILKIVNRVNFYNRKDV